MSNRVLILLAKYLLFDTVQIESNNDEVDRSLHCYREGFGPRDLDISSRIHNVLYSNVTWEPNE